MKYKVVELNTVTDSEIEKTINEWQSMGWTFEYVQFTMHESSKRPSMAFIYFTKSEEQNH